MNDCIRLCQSQGYLRWFLDDRKELPLILCDNQSALALSKTSVTPKKSKHFALRYMLVRDYFKSFGYVPTDLNKSDPLTKPLHGPKYIQLFKHDVADLGERYEHARCYMVDFRNST